MNETPSDARLPSFRAILPSANSYAPIVCSGLEVARAEP